MIDIDIVMPIYNLVYSDACSKTPGNLWQYYSDEPSLDDNSNIDFPANNNNISFNFKQ